MHVNDKERLKQGIVLLAIAICGGVMLYTLYEFITAMLGALIFYVLLRPLRERLISTYGWKPRRAVWLLLVGSFLVVLIPVLLFVYLLYYEAQTVANSPDSLIDYFKVLDSYVQNRFGFRLLSDDVFTNLKSSFVGWLSSLLNQTLSVAGSIAILYFVLYYMLLHAERLEATVRSYSPFQKRENGRLFSEELKSQTYSNAIAVPVLAVLQGIVAGLGFWIFGVDQPVFWGVICGFFSILPVLGTALVWVPAGLAMLVTAELWQGLGLLAYGALIISNIDNVMRFMLQKRFADVHPLITVFGVITGLKVFGLPGLIFGPLLISYFLILIRVYRNEYWDDAGDESSGS